MANGKPGRPRKVVEPEVAVVATETKEAEQVTPAVADSQASVLVDALVKALNATKPVEKKNPFNRKVNTPWTPKDGSPRARLKRKTYQHGQLLNTDNGDESMTNEDIELCNRLRPGVYCDGDVKVIRRKDRGLDIDYPIRTASQRLKLLNKHGIRNFKELVTRLVQEGENPAQFKQTEDDDF